MNDLIVLLMREFGWTLEYTTHLVGTLPIKKLNALIKELKYQKAVENYQIASNFAMIIASWASAQSKRTYRVSDFIGQPPSRNGKKDDLYDKAEKAGIRMPKGG